MYGDLMALRARLLRITKDLTNVMSAFTREGVVHCYLQNGSRMIVESPDNLFRLGLDEVNPEGDWAAICQFLGQTRRG